MSLRWFVYYCAICGAWAGLVGWFLGLLFSPTGSSSDYGKMILHTSMLGMFLGLVVALGLSFLDAVFNLSLRQMGKVALRTFSAMLVGVFGGLFGSFIGGSLYFLAQHYLPDAISSIFFIVGWTIVGFLVGASISFSEVLGSLYTRKDFAGSYRKFLKCLIGGTVGGVVGGVLAIVMNSLGAAVFMGRDPHQLYSPTAFGFVAIGACIGLLVGLAQVILKEAWIKVEAGFRPGREMILTKERTSIGRAEGSDIALFGDGGVEKTHACIVQDGSAYYLEDQHTPGGSYVNDQKVNGRAPLKAGDLIRVGKSALRFNERVKKKA